MNSLLEMQEKRATKFAYLRVLSFGELPTRDDQTCTATMNICRVHCSECTLFPPYAYKESARYGIPLLFLKSSNIIQAVVLKFTMKCDTQKIPTQIAQRYYPNFALELIPQKIICTRFPFHLATRRFFLYFITGANASKIPGRRVQHFETK